MKRNYPTDLTDGEWKYIEPSVPAPKCSGRQTIYSLREILNVLFFYVLRSGCPWRLSPRDFPPWRAVYYWYQRMAYRGHLLRAVKRSVTQAP
jgi:transposase